MEKKYEGFLNSFFKKEHQINKICRQYNITKYTINSDGSIDVYGNVNLVDYNLIKLPLIFRKVTGDFDCSYNRLTSLEGSPKNIGNFFCYYNKLTSLEGGPTHVSSNFYCYHNKLMDLNWCPEFINNLFDFSYNNVISLEGFPTHVGYFYCESNPVYEIWKLFKDKSKIELFNDYDIIRGTDIAIDRLNDFLITIGKDPVESVKGYNNI